MMTSNYESDDRNDGAKSRTNNNGLRRRDNNAAWRYQQKGAECESRRIVSNISSEGFGAGEQYILPKSRCKHEYDARPILSAFQIPGAGQTLPLEFFRIKKAGADSSSAPVSAASDYALR
jgi:hypothetical protein